MTLSAMEFLRRFVQHILPRGFVRIRQFGCLANACRAARVARARTLLGTASPSAPTPVAGDRARDGLSLVWRVTHRDGRTTQFWGHTSFPEVICGDVLLSHHPAGLETGQRRIEANGLVIHGWGYGDEYYDQFLGQFVDQKDTLLAHAVELHIELNAVIFADGTLIGPDDQSALTDLFSTYVQAKQDGYRGIIAALDAGQSGAESFAPVERFLADATNRMRARNQVVREKPADLWTHQAAADAGRWRRRYADGDIAPLLKQVIRLDPFTIRRG